MQVITSDLIGVPFLNGGRAMNGFDCYGLSMEVFKRHGIVLQDYIIHCEDASRINEQINTYKPQWVSCKGELPIPCLVVMRFGSEWCNHTGVYIGSGKFIHTREKIGVNIDRIDSISWKRKIEGFYILRG